MERFYIWLAWRLPRTLVYWAAIRLGANATQEVYLGGPEYSLEHQVESLACSVPELLFLDALDRW